MFIIGKKDIPKLRLKVSILNSLQKLND